MKFCFLPLKKFSAGETSLNFFRDKSHEDNFALEVRGRFCDPLPDVLGSNLCAVEDQIQNDLTYLVLGTKIVC